MHNNAFGKNAQSGWSENNFAKTLSEDVNSGFIAFYNDLAVGFIVFSVIKQESELLSIGILPSHQGQKIASKLLEKYIRNLSDKKVEESFLEVAEDNILAIEFYLKNNFQKFAIRKNYYKREGGKMVNAIIMKRQIC